MNTKAELSNVEQQLKEEQLWEALKRPLVVNDDIETDKEIVNRILKTIEEEISLDCSGERMYKKFGRAFQRCRS